ncbi:MAG: Lrp/AsnC family transcriptional regulator, partial [Xanthomonadales bacterium]|nr:Lrp/AsnC family transcriptional regulator [Xanthomonadales bacterium]
MHMIKLDKLDRKIIRLLQKDASLSAAAIGEQIGLSQSPCWRRIQRIKDAGLVKDQGMVFDRRKLGFDTMVFAHVKLTAHGRSKVAEFSETIRQFPEVMECHLLLGQVDFLLRIVTPDLEAYERFFFEKLSQLPDVQEVTSNIVLTEAKHTTELPV